MCVCVCVCVCVCSPQLFSMTRRWVQGSQEGVREGGCAPFARGNF